MDTVENFTIHTFLYSDIVYDILFNARKGITQKCGTKTDYIFRNVNVLRKTDGETVIEFDKTKCWFMYYKSFKEGGMNWLKKFINMTFDKFLKLMAQAEEYKNSVIVIQYLRKCFKAGAVFNHDNIPDNIKYIIGQKIDALTSEIYSVYEMNIAETIRQIRAELKDIKRNFSIKFNCVQKEKEDAIYNLEKKYVSKIKSIKDDFKTATGHEIGITKAEIILEKDRIF